MFDFVHVQVAWGMCAAAASSGTYASHTLIVVHGMLLNPTPLCLNITYTPLRCCHKTAACANPHVVVHYSMPCRCTAGVQQVCSNKHTQQIVSSFQVV